MVVKKIVTWDMAMSWIWHVTVENKRSRHAPLQFLKIDMRHGTPPPPSPSRAPGGGRRRGRCWRPLQYCLLSAPVNMILANIGKYFADPSRPIYCIYLWRLQGFLGEVSQTWSAYITHREWDGVLYLNYTPQWTTSNCILFCISCFTNITHRIMVHTLNTAMMKNN